MICSAHMPVNFRWIYWIFCKHILWMQFYFIYLTSTSSLNVSYYVLLTLLNLEAKFANDTKLKHPPLQTISEQVLRYLFAERKLYTANLQPFSPIMMMLLCWFWFYCYTLITKKDIPLWLPSPLLENSTLWNNL